MTAKIKIGLALGGGGARGNAHIGIIKALMDAGYSIVSLSGISMGAIIAGGFAHKQDIHRAEKFTLEQKYLQFIKKYHGIPRIDTDGLTEYLNEYMTNCDFNQLSLPLRIFTVDLKTKSGYTFEKGNVAKAMVASSLAPYIHKPIIHENKLLVDGALLSDAAIDLADSKEADILIGVKVSRRNNVNNFSNKTLTLLSPLSSLFQHFKHSRQIMRNEIHKLRTNHIEKPIIMIRPELENIGLLDFQKAPEAIELGYQAIKKNIHEIESVYNQSLLVG